MLGNHVGASTSLGLAPSPHVPTHGHPIGEIVMYLGGTLIKKLID